MFLRAPATETRSYLLNMQAESQRQKKAEKRKKKKDKKRQKTGKGACVFARGEAMFLSFLSFLLILFLALFQRMYMRLLLITVWRNKLKPSHWE
jgi:hypothetical protein